MYNFQDSSGSVLATFYFVALVLMWAILFLNIIVAILFSNYEDNDKEENEDFKELEDKAIELGMLVIFIFPYYFWILSVS